MIAERSVIVTGIISVEGQKETQKPIEINKRARRCGQDEWRGGIEQQPLLSDKQQRKEVYKSSC